MSLSALLSVNITFYCELYMVDFLKGIQYPPLVLLFYIYEEIEKSHFLISMSKSILLFCHARLKQIYIERDFVSCLANNF